MMVDRDRQGLLTIVGISAGVATGVAASIVSQVPSWAEPRGSAQDVAASLASDPKLSRRRVEVDTIAEGVVELSGSVRNRAEAERAVGLAQRTTGVYTVVNRLRIEAEELQRESTRRRWSEGAPELRERHHYGMGVGMGQSRHAPETDPDRPNDKQRILDRELDVANVDDENDVAPGRASSGGTVDDPYMKPGDESAIREAGLDPSPHPLSGAEEDVEPETDAEDRM
jgi:hypothetical protein